jgi:hypothetical protein
MKGDDDRIEVSAVRIQVLEKIADRANGLRFGKLRPDPCDLTSCDFAGRVLAADEIGWRERAACMVDMGDL